MLIKSHVKHRARNYNIRLPGDYEFALMNSIKGNIFDCKLVFSWLFDMGSKTLNACALLPGIIIVNSEWAAHLVLFRNPETINAFWATIGHEMTHKDNDYVFWEFWTKDKTFVNWINEVHADFGGTIKCLDGKRAYAIRAVSYKKKYKGKKDRDTLTHPSWNKRLEYISKYNFNEALIRKIATDVGCKNEKLINNICSYYAVLRLI